MLAPLMCNGSTNPDLPDSLQKLGLWGAFLLAAQLRFHFFVKPKPLLLGSGKALFELCVLSDRIA